MSISFKNEDKIMDKYSELERQFIDACTSGTIEEVKKCLDEGVNININTYIFRIGSDYYPLLVLLYYRNRVDIIDLLFERGIDIESRSLCGDTSLVIMCELKDYNYARDLIRRGANVNTMDDDGYTALHWVANHIKTSVRDSCGRHIHEKRDTSEYIDFFKELIDWGADPYAIYKGKNRDETPIDRIFYPECKKEIEDYINRGKNTKRAIKNF